ncbi:MAG TPA: hypothetical protein VJV23_13190 [Candidatus Polarisedimenticolia bacterium]|nr:hypothetical protein [Candidatus Polarisedimenticolia bacterium]
MNRPPASPWLRRVMPALLATVPLLLVSAGLPAQEGSRLTLGRVFELLRAGTPSAQLLAMVEQSGSDFGLTIEDVVRLHKMGASRDLIRALARGTPSASAPAAVEEDAPAPFQPLPGALTLRQVARLHARGTPPAELAERIGRHGLKSVPTLDEMLEQAERGLPAEVLLALARGARPESLPAEPPLDAAGILALLEQGGDPAQVAGAIRRRGLAAPLALQDVLALRKSGADDQVMAAVREASAPRPSPAAVGEESRGAGREDEPAGGEEPEAQTPAAPEPAQPSATPTADTGDRVWVSSVPAGARVFVSTARTNDQEVFDHDHYVGRTPLSLALDPGDYTIVVQKEAGEFEAGLLPAWRTVHDTPSTRSLLDEADLTFRPDRCCLPGTLDGRVEVKSVPAGARPAAIGDQFDGLPPFLFDGEGLQILRVRRARITHAMKLYPLRKHPGQSRVLIATFLPAEGDPLDQADVIGLPSGTPFDAHLEAPGLEMLGAADRRAGLARILRVEEEHLEQAIGMLRRAGKAILHQQIEGGLRLVSLAVDDHGRLRLSDMEVKPIDLFAPPPPPPPRRKKTPPPPPPPPPSLPGMDRLVVPGLGLPRLAVHNTGKEGIGLLMDDGALYYVPAGARREFSVDPGTFQARVLTGGPSPDPRGRLHFSYNARYTITF